MERAYQKQLEDFFKQYTKLTYKSGSIIASQGADASGIYYIQRGCVTGSIVLDNTKPPVRTQLYVQGYIFDIAWALQVPTFHEFEAISSVTLYRAPQNMFAQFLKENSQLTFIMMKQLIEVTRLKDLRNAIMIQETANVKVAYMLLFLSQYFGNVESGEPITISLSQKELASWMGVTRETVSAQMQLLESEKIITKSREHIKIVDFPALRKKIPLNN